MANRRGYKKPDPAIKKDVIRARQDARKGGGLKGFVVSVSLASTLLGWAAFSQHDARIDAANQVATQAAASQVAVDTIQQAIVTSVATATPGTQSSR